MMISGLKNQIITMTMDPYTQATGKENIDMDMAYNSIRMDQNMMVIGTTIKKTDKEHLNTPMAMYTMVVGKTIWPMDMEYIQLCTATDSKETGRTI